jgi:hypothetical protein
MMVKRVFEAMGVALLLLAGVVRAGEFGTATEAKAMLEKAVAAVKADRAAALAQLTKGGGGFKDRDLYPFCGGPDGNFTAHPKLVGQSLKDLKDKAGKALGAEMYQVAAEGKLAEVAYAWPRPGTTEPVAKVLPAEELHWGDRRRARSASMSRPAHPGAPPLVLQPPPWPPLAAGVGAATRTSADARFPSESAATTTSMVPPAGPAV